MDYRQGQGCRSLDPRDHKHVVVVCGSRGWGDKWKFHKKVVAYLATLTDSVLFVSGAANSGADRMIIDWCKRFGFPCLEIPADWDKYGKSAGYRRNEKMGAICNAVLAFWDMESRGTAHMLRIASENNHPTVIINVGSKYAEIKHHETLELAKSAVCVSGEFSGPEAYESIEDFSV